MTAIINWLKRWLGPVKPAVIDTGCQHCRGYGYDVSGFACTCQLQAKVARVGRKIHGRKDLARTALLVIAVLAVSVLTVEVMR